MFDFHMFKLLKIPCVGNLISIKELQDICLYGIIASLNCFVCTQTTDSLANGTDIILGIIGKVVRKPFTTLGYDNTINIKMLLFSTVNKSL